MIGIDVDLHSDEGLSEAVLEQFVNLYNKGINL